MSDYIEGLINQYVQVVTIEGRVFLGVLISFDDNINIIIDKSHERIYKENKTCKKELLGLYMIKGDNIAIISGISEEKYNEDVTKIISPPLKSFNLND